ncbi:pirin family protein [Kitasatospora cheerisanensis]|uniref:Quercetin 2,3-dioxygenase n=1 Tax=Kitasatospora cheerisanensis KCTC 2395 TaxID=1348663 RepID=A0A066YWY8_9ACTN|nr:pirin family protein [Kitasatospora cheerisanensis]KDN86058.1 quercetin 2,3-dioxygenase [Kitasatospora cheerisanensis KCTC 2395]
MASTIDLRRADQRFHTRAGWLDSKHSFSFSHHWDPANTHFGLLLVSNDDIVAPGTGFETHPHRDMEIITWVLDGGLVHQDSEGHNGVIYPGLAQRMSAGTGILHSEKNDSWTLTGEPRHQDPVRFIQMWTLPDAAGIVPGYEQLDINDQLSQGGWTTLASGMGKHANQRAIGIRQKHAALHVARMRPEETLELATAPFVHLYVARGEAAVEGAGLLHEGDALRITAAEGQRVTAGPDGAELLQWEMTAALD